MTYKKWLRPLWITVFVTVLLAAYVGIFKTSARGFFVDLSNSMFLWGLTLLCISLIYVTRFFGFLPYFQNWFRFRPFKHTIEGEEPGSHERDEQDKRDPSLVYASLLLMLLSIPVFYL